MQALFVLSSLIATASIWAAGPKYGPADRPFAEPVSRSHAYLQTHPAPDFWTLMPFYAGQRWPYSCSAASVTMLLNAALRAGRTLDDDARNFDEESTLRSAGVNGWSARMSRRGAPKRQPPKHGLTLQLLGEAVTRSLERNGVRGSTISAVQVSEASPSLLAELRGVLSENEKGSRDFVLAHFCQDALTDAPGGPFPHIAPVGAYDEEGRRVLIMDVDREWYEPYWVDDARLLEAMSRRTEPFGYGGWVRASLP